MGVANSAGTSFEVCRGFFGSLCSIVLKITCLVCKIIQGNSALFIRLIFPRETQFELQETKLYFSIDPATNARLGLLLIGRDPNSARAHCPPRILAIFFFIRSVVPCNARYGKTFRIRWQRTLSISDVQSIICTLYECDFCRRREKSCGA